MCENQYVNIRDLIKRKIRRGDVDSKDPRQPKITRNMSSFISADLQPTYIFEEDNCLDELGSKKGDKIKILSALKRDDDQYTTSHLQPTDDATMQRLIDFSLDYDMKNPTQNVSNKKIDTDILLDEFLD